jgi:hypothetical protein
MMADFGLTLEHAESVLGLAGQFIDFAKIAVGTGGARGVATLVSHACHPMRTLATGAEAHYLIAEACTDEWSPPTGKCVTHRPEPVGLAGGQRLP